MSRQKSNYKSTHFGRFERWVNGEVDPLGRRMEIVPPPSSSLTGETVTVDYRKIHNKAFDIDHNREVKHYRTFYKIMFILLCLGIIGVLMWTVSYLSVFRNAGSPDNNEVSARYISRGFREAGAINMVTGMILGYRAFDTFGEPYVLFIAFYCMMILLRIDKSSDSKAQKKRMARASDRLYESKNDIILQKMTCVLVPLILIFGIYIILNEHLSPGGGFSGGAIAGSRLILYLNAFGFEKTSKFFTEKTFRCITLGVLSFYCIAKSYSFFTGVSHLASGISLGTPGTALSSGLILPSNICVGLVVTCAAYILYSLFRKGGM